MDLKSSRARGGFQGAGSGGRGAWRESSNFTWLEGEREKD